MTEDELRLRLATLEYRLGRHAEYIGAIAIVVAILFVCIAFFGRHA